MKKLIDLPPIPKPVSPIVSPKEVLRIDAFIAQSLALKNAEENCRMVLRRRNPNISYVEEQDDKPKPKIIQPRKVGECKYEWKEVEVRQSKEKGAGSGVFAQKNLPVGVMIPIIGNFQSGEVPTELTHGWQYQRQPYFVDGDPTQNPHKGVGNFGLSIAMMCNELTKGVHNCVFRLDYLVTALPIKKGEELTAYYGDWYDKHREDKGYSLKDNKNLQYPYPELEKLEHKDYPSAKERKKIYTKWNKVVKECKGV